jgi:histidyl-tRNA synthetase
MSIGIERLIMAMQANEIELPAEPVLEFYILALDEEALPVAFRLAELARHNGVPAMFDCQPRSARAGMKAANRSGARVALIIGGDEAARGVAQWKHLESGEQVELPMSEIERNLAEA